MPKLFPMIPHQIPKSTLSPGPTIVNKFRNGKEQRITLPGSALRSYELEWSGLTAAEYNILYVFFQEHGCHTGFVFFHPDLRENIYVKFVTEDIEQNTVKTDNYYVSVKIQELDEEYTDEITGSIIYDIGGVL